MSGLVHALGADRVLGVDCGAVSDPVATVTELVNGLSAHGAVPKLRLRLDQVGNGYSELSAKVQDAIVIAARTEGIVLDPFYTGRAFAGLVAAVRDNDIRPGRRTYTPHRRNAWSLRTPASHDLGSQATGGATLVWSLDRARAKLAGRQRLCRNDGSDLHAKWVVAFRKRPGAGSHIRDSGSVGKVPRLKYSGLRTAG